MLILSASSLKRVMEEEEESNNSSRKCTPKSGSFRGRESAYSYQYHHRFLRNSYRLDCGFGFGYQNQYQTFPALLPLPTTIPLQLTVTSPFPQNQSFGSCIATSSECQPQDFSVAPGMTLMPFFVISLRCVWMLIVSVANGIGALVLFFK